MRKGESYEFRCENIQGGVGDHLAFFVVLYYCPYFFMG